MKTLTHRSNTIQVLIVILISLNIISSCSDNKNSDNAQTPDEAFPVELVKRSSEERKAQYSLDSLDLNKLKTVDSVFFKKWFTGISGNNIDTTLQYDPYSGYYYFDHKEIDDRFLFSILHADEVGYWNLYHFTVDKKKGSITMSDLIAQTGGDGGHVNIDKLTFNQTGDVLTRTSVSEFHKDLDKGYTRDYDSTITRIEFTLDKTIYHRIDSLRRIDTVFVQ